MLFINTAGRKNSLIRRKRKRITGGELGQKKKNTSTSLLATGMDGVKEKCMAHSVKCLRSLRRTAKV